MSSVEVILNSPIDPPTCPHGPTILFSRTINGKKRNFFACSACRDRKLCSFFVYQDELAQFDKSNRWKNESAKYLADINHRKLFLTLNEIRKLPESKRAFCRTCNKFELQKYWPNHQTHQLVIGVTNHQIEHPSEFLPPLEDSKKEAQFLFAKHSVQVIITLIQQLNYRKVICMGTPRLHEFIQNNPQTNLSSILLDFDQRFHSFYSPLDFCWYNAFNNHFFFDEAKQVFDDFIKTAPNQLILVTDPPFGGRIEPLAQTLRQITSIYQKHNVENNLPIFFIFPYFMEPQIRNNLPDFHMLDYKVDYDNHPLFQTDVPKARKLGSPVRIFTNIPPENVQLPSDAYRHCPECNKWVYNENKHCNKCGQCPSKDGSTYVHCNKCKRCVKPTWRHCETCKRCAQIDHKCQQLDFQQNCFNCNEAGHKKRDCPRVNHMEMHRKRKQKMLNTQNKIKKR